METMTGLLVLGLYLLPSIAAARRRHHNQFAILVLNVFLGWTFIGWVVALVWSCTTIAPERDNRRLAMSP